MTELGDLRELLRRAESPFASVRAELRLWRHDLRALPAARAATEKLKRQGPAVIEIGPRSEGSAVGGEHEELLRVWRAGDRMREEIQGGPEAGSFLVRVGRRWWRWNERYGVSSGERDSMAGGIGGPSWVMFNPTALSYVLRLRLVGRGQRAGRMVILAEGSPRAPGRDQIHSLVQLGWGADRYRLEVDAKRGILLGAVAVRSGEPFREITAVKVALDEPIDDERFVFRPPAG